jgi:hypothetical protein
VATTNTRRIVDRGVFRLNVIDRRPATLPNICERGREEIIYLTTARVIALRWRRIERIISPSLLLTGKLCQCTKTSWMGRLTIAEISAFELCYGRRKSLAHIQNLFDLIAQRAKNQYWSALENDSELFVRFQT